jgi:uncharacterized membrane protein
MSFLRARPAGAAGRLILAVCLSMTVMMVVGGVASLVGPPLGVAHPLNAVPETVIWLVLAVVTLVSCAVKSSNPVTWLIEGIKAPGVVSVVAGALLVLLSILGVARLNHSGNNDLAVVATCLDITALLAGVVVGWNRSRRWPFATLLYSASLALLVSTSLRGGHLYGWDIQQEFGVASRTLRAGVWVIPANHDPYASMLSLTVLPVILHSVAKLRLLAFFQLVIPAILALLPLAVFSTVRNVPRWITSGRSTPRPGLAYAVVVGLIVSSVAFSSQLVSITRQAMSMTMLTALVMVIFDRTITKRRAQVVVGILTVAISFTHYTTSYLLAVIMFGAWIASFLWTRGWLGTPRARVERHQYDMRSRRIINTGLVVVAIVAAFGWNLAITHNDALNAPASAITTRGAGLSTSTGTTFIPPRQLERILVSELQQNANWIVPVPGSSSVRLVAASFPSLTGALPKLRWLWGKVTYVVTESLWIVLGIALLHGLLRLGRRRSYEYSADLVGLAAAGLMIGGFLRFSGTLAAYYNPERAAIFTAILLAAPATLLLDDVVALVYSERDRLGGWLTRVSFGAAIIYLMILVLPATGLDTFVFGGVPPGSLSAQDLNVKDFTVSAPELATAQWLQENVRSPNVVQSDLYGQLVLLSEPGSYSLLDEIVPPEVNDGSYIYLSTTNVTDHVSQAAADNGNLLTIYQSNLRFFNRNFNVVYSTGVTRVYH